MTKINFIDVGCADRLISPWVNSPEYLNFVLGFDINKVSKYDKSLTDMGIPHKICKKFIFTSSPQTVHIYRKKKTSSIFEIDKKKAMKYMKQRKVRTPDYDRFDLIREVQVECVRLDEVISQSDREFDFVKTDAQGADFQVIQSLGKFLDSQIIGIHVELFLKPLYKGIVLYEETDRYLRDHGFYQAIRFGKGKWANDFLYLREDKLKNDKKELIKEIYK